MITLRLGLRFVRGGGRRGAFRLGLVVLGTALGVWSLLAAMALPAVLSARQDRAAARWPVPGEAETGAQAWYRPSLLRTNGREVRLLVVAGDSVARMPPGITRLPRDGEAVVSPALRDLVAESQTARSAFRYADAGLIGDSGLLSPDELFAYVGADVAALRREGGTPLHGFGVRYQPELDLTKGDMRLAQWAVLGLVGVPLAVYFATCARLSAATRARRLAALRLVGLTARDTLRVDAVEAVAGGIVGATLGLAAYYGTAGAFATVGAGGLRWFRADAVPRTATAIAVLVAVPVAAAAVSRAGARRAVDHALDVRRQATTAPPSWWRLVPVAVGTAVLLGLLVPALLAPEGRSAPSRAAFLLVAGVVVTGTGLALGFGPASVALARALAGRTRRVWLRLAMRRLELDPSGALRVVAGLVVVVFGLGFAAGILRDAEAAASPLADVVGYRVPAAQLREGAVDRLGSVPGVRGVVLVTTQVPPSGPPAEAPASGAGGTEAGQVMVGAPEDGPVAFAIGTCASVAALIVTPLDGCRDGQAYRIEPAGFARNPAVRPGRAVRLLGHHTHATDDGPHAHGEGDDGTYPVTVPFESLAIPAPRAPLVQIDVVLPPSAIAGHGVPETAEVIALSDADTATIESVSAGIAAIAPGATVDVLDGDAAARSRARTLRGLLDAALALGVLVGIVSFVVATVDRSVERRSNLASLRIVGVPRRTLRAAQAAQVGVPVAVGVVGALVMGTLAEQTTVALGGYDRSLDWGSLAARAGAGAIAALVAVLCALVASTPRVDPSLVRRD